MQINYYYNNLGMHIQSKAFTKNMQKIKCFDETENEKEI